MISAWNGARGRSAAISRTYPGRPAISAPLIPSSTKIARGICLRVLDLSRDRLRLVRDAVLVRGLAGVDSSNHVASERGQTACC